MARKSSVSTPVNSTSAFDKYLGNVYTAAFQSAKAFRSCVEVLAVMTPADWSNAEKVASVSKAFRIGRMAASLDYTEAQAKVTHDKKGWTALHPNSGDDTRTETEQKAYRAAVSSWENASVQAGAPKVKGTGSRRDRNAKIRETRAAKNAAVSGKPGVVDSKSDAPNLDATASAKLKAHEALSAQLATSLFTVPSKLDDVTRFACQMAEILEAFNRRAGAKAPQGPWFGLFSGFVKAVRDTAKAMGANQAVTKPDVALSAVIAASELPSVPEPVAVASPSKAQRQAKMAKAA